MMDRVSATLMLYPMFALVLLTSLVGLALGGSRLYSVRKGIVKPRFYKTFEGEGFELERKISRNFSNLFEVPLLFYTVGILTIVLDKVTTLLLIMAWVFVVMRAIHTLIHITYNFPIHRLIVFVTSSTLVVVMWVALVCSV